MKTLQPQEHHLSDEELLQALDGELSARDQARVHSHLETCWSCRTRQRTLETAIGDFVGMYQSELEDRIPSSEGPRALLKAQLTELAATQDPPWGGWFRSTSWKLTATFVAATFTLAVTAYFAFGFWAKQNPVGFIAVTLPDPKLTPGATVLLSRADVCRARGASNKDVAVTLQRKVFDEYRIPTFEPNAYEVDYLITPGLGGADDIHNLWPQPKAAVWNSLVKDGLEDHLRDLVCEGRLDLATAQREIATNWIEAYKKYFHTERPLSEYR